MNENDCDKIWQHPIYKKKIPQWSNFRGPIERKVPAILPTLKIPRNPHRYSYKKKTGIVSKVVISSEWLNVSKLWNKIVAKLLSNGAGMSIAIVFAK